MTHPGTNQPPNQPPHQPPNQPPFPPQGPYGYPGQQPPGGGPPRRRTVRNIVLVVAVLVVAGAAVVAVPKLIDTSSASGQHNGGSGDQADCTSPDFELNNGLAGNFTAALQKHSKTAFLAIAATQAAKAPMSTWWDNVNALGFTTGGAQVEDRGNPTEASLRMKIGFHNKLDSTSKDAHDRNTPDTPATEYQLATKRIHDGGPASTKCHLAITGWKPLSNAPWDVKQKLYVVKTQHIVIAGEPRMKSEVQRIAPIAEKAAAWDHAFFKLADRADYIHLTGYLVFVPSTAQEEQHWFRAPTAKKPSGWVADVGGAAGVQFPLPGVQVPISGMPEGSPKLAPVSTNTGGGRVIVTATGRHEDDVRLEATLVHEFVHAIFANDDIGAYLDGDPVPGAVSEGAARWIESYFVSAPNDANSPNMHALPHLKDGLRPYFSSFDGKWPANGQIYGAAATADYYYDLAATTFDYEASYGLGFAVQCVLLAYTNGGGPFTGVEVSNKGGNIKFADPAQEQAKWAAWIRQMMAA